jgi:hypothetical protein
MIVKIAPNHTRGFSVLALGRVRPSPSERVPSWSGEGRWPVPAACPMKQQTGVIKGQSRTEQRRSTAAPARAQARTTPQTSLPSWCCRASQGRPSGLRLRHHTAGRASPLSGRRVSASSRTPPATHSAWCSVTRTRPDSSRSDERLSGRPCDGATALRGPPRAIMTVPLTIVLRDGRMIRRRS